MEELTGLGVERKVGREKVADDPQHPKPCRRGQHRVAGLQKGSMCVRLGL